MVALSVFLISLFLYRSVSLPSRHQKNLVSSVSCCAPPYFVFLGPGCPSFVLATAGVALTVHLGKYHLCLCISRPRLSFLLPGNKQTKLKTKKWTMNVAPGALQLGEVAEGCSSRRASDETRDCPGGVVSMVLFLLLLDYKSIIMPAGTLPSLSHCGF